MNDCQLLSVSKVSKSFGGVTAIDKVTFSIGLNRIKSIIGPNGAGKTTLFNLISGVVRPSRGRMQFKGTNLVGLSPNEIGSLGIARTFQNVLLFSKMTVLENVMVGFHRTADYRLMSSLFRTKDFKAQEAAIGTGAGELIVLVGLESRMNETAGNLPYGEQKLLEIARALATAPALLLLDEPAAGLNTAEQDNLIRLIRRIRERNIAVLLVEHNMKVVMALSDEILVLDYGREIATGAPEEIKANQKVIEAYLGKGIEFARNR